jgi:hypothetical protein
LYIVYCILNTDIIENTNINTVIDVTKVRDVTDITVNVSYDSYDLSSTSDISHVTTTEKVLKAHHKVDKEYNTNASPVLSSGLTTCPSRPPKKLPYSKQCGNTNLHDMPSYESLQAHVYEVETVVVPDDDITDDLNHGDDDLYDASYELDPFDIDTPVVTIQDYACMDEKVCMPQDKWFGINQKTKELWDQIDDNDKTVILGYTNSSSPSPFPSRPLSKPPFPLKQCSNINLHEMAAYDLLQVHTHELEPDPAAPDESITEDPPILDHNS